MHRRIRLCALLLVLLAGTGTTGASSPVRVPVPTARAEQDGQKGTQKDSDRRPKFVLRANPLVATSPARIVLTGELVGGADDFEEYYCVSTQWEWGDDTSSESNTDCPPYEAGKSQIKRRFAVEHVFRRAGNYRVMLHLKQRSRTVATATTNLQIRPGVREFGP